MTLATATLKELREQRGQLVVQLRAAGEAFHANGKKFTDETRANWDKLNTDERALVAQIEARQKEEDGERAVAERIAQLAEVESTPAQRVGAEQVHSMIRRGATMTDSAVRTWGRLGNDMLAAEVSTQEREVFAQYREHIYSDGRRGVRVGPCDANNLSIRLDGGYGLGRAVSGRAMARSEAEFRARHQAEMLNSMGQRAAMGVSVDMLGGAAVPEGFTYKLEFALRAYGGIREHSTITRTETAAPLPMPTIVDATPGQTDPIYGGAQMNVGQLLGENNPTALTGLSPVMGALLLGAQKFSSQFIPISHELLRDAAFPMPDYLGDICGTRLGRVMARVFAFGSGGGVVPRGIGRDAPISYVTAASGSIGYPDMVKMMHTVDPAYRMPGACWLMHDLMVQNMRLILDGLGRPIWVDNLNNVMSVDRPSALMGYPVQTVQEMPYDFSGDTLDPYNNIVQNPQLLIYGHVPHYQIREVQTVRLRRLVERAAELDQELFIAFMEADGGLLNAGTLPVKAMGNHGQALGRVRFGTGKPNGRTPAQMLASRGQEEGVMADPANELNPIDVNNPPPRSISETDKANAAAVVANAKKKDS